MTKILSVALLFLLFFLFPQCKIFAEEKFSTYYFVTYSVKENGTTRVNLDVELKNKTSDYYAASYNIQTGFKSIKNISAKDSGGNLPYKEKPNIRGVELLIDFNRNIVGINNSQKFQISFDTNEVSIKNGNVWEVNVPGISNQADFDDFSINVVVPESFGNPTIIKPHLTNLVVSKNSLKFSKFDLEDSGVSITYGESQFYNFNLSYHLKNEKLFPINTEIAIPSDNSYQTVQIYSIDPKPNDVEIDEDGNWLAKYRLLPSQTLDIKVVGNAKVSLKPRKESLSPTQSKKYLSMQKYWETDDTEIKKLATKLKTPRAIYDYVVDNLNYDASRVKDTQVRAGAKGVLLNKKSAVCLEFTDLFIALARSAGIPARAVEGFANTTNTAERPLSLVKDVLHSWPQYYDFQQQSWIMVDPTWGNTTKGLDYFNVLDFDHLSFAIKGIESDYPVPAGGYKITGEESTKDVEVKASGKTNSSNPVLSVDVQFEKKYFAGLPISGKVEIINYSKTVSPEQTVTISSTSLKPNKKEISLNQIPPYGKEKLNVEFSPVGILTNGTATFKIGIGKDTLERKIYFIPFYKNKLVILGGIIIGSISLILLGIAIRSRRLHVS